MLKIKALPLLFLIFVTLWLRLVNLGYSDYQGDEIKALFLPDVGQTGLQFLMEQRKGPVQFLVTYAMQIFSSDYLNQFVMRLPFAIAGILAVYFFYKFVKLHFDEKTTLYASLFMAMNGFFVAFSRLVQYQAFTLLFCILALYFFSLTIKDARWKIKGWYIGAIFWALSILAHYDGGFIAPFVLYILVRWFKEDADGKKLEGKVKIKHILLSGLIFLGLLSIFFVPYVFSISEATKDYWLNRLSGGEGKISSSIVTFKVYNPKLMFYIYAGLSATSLIKFKKIWPIVMWAAFPLFVWEVITSVPGTHIYNYVLPITILVALGITVIEEQVIKVLKPKFGKILNVLGLMILFVFTFFLSHTVFVNNTTEYPWEDEKFLIWTLNKPNPIFHLSLFGFPYNRQWETIGSVINASDVEYYSTNERDSISRFYVTKPKDTNNAGYYVSVNSPQSFSPPFLQEKSVYWGENHDPVMEIRRGEKVLVRIYLMPTGGLKDIRSLGY